jgi:hypothetical protein
MAKSRKKVRKVAKRPAKKRKAVAKAKARKPARKKARKVKPRKQTSFIDAVTGTVTETGALRRRLAGPNTFED